MTELPSEESIKKKFKELLDAKMYDDAAKLVVYYSVAKMDVEKFVDGLVNFAKASSEERQKMIDDLKIKNLRSKVK